MEYSYDLKIPKERIAVLIGTKGQIKRKIEKTTGVHLDIDSKEGDIQIAGEDSLNLYTAREVIQAVGRGFNPEVAFLILKPDYALEIINMQDYAGKEKKTLPRVRARVIGTQGKTRKFIEESTETYLSIFGKTVSIIGEVEHVAIARQAIETLLTGSPHTAVYKWLEKKQRELKRKQVPL